MRRSTRATAALALVWSGVAAGAAAAGSVHGAPPASPDPGAKYLFYLHGRSVETNRPVDGVPVEYERILRSFADRGFVVLGERRGEVRPGEYARKIADQVRALIAGGVPARNITVSGHSKGGLMTMIVSTMIEAGGVNYVNMAGCARPGAAEARQTETFAQRDAKKMRGRLLVLYDRADEKYGPCPPELFERATRLADKHVTVLATDRGHALFARPDPRWLDVVQAWAEGRPAP